MFSRVALSLCCTFLLAFAPAVEAQVALKPKFEPGTKFKQRDTSKVSQILTLNGAALPTKIENVAVQEFTYQPRDDKGNLPIDVKFVSIVADLSLPGGISLKFDSAKPDEKAANPQLEAALGIFRKLNGLTVTHAISADLKVVSVEGIQEGTQLNADELKEKYQQEIDMLPEKAVKPGDTWERKFVQGLGQGQIMTFNRKFEYHGQAPQFPTVKDSKMLDKITATDSSVEFSVAPGRGLPITVNKSDLKVESSKHTYLFDRDAGRMVQADSELKITGKLSLSINGMNVDGDLDLSLAAKEEEIE